MFIRQVYRFAFYETNGKITLMKAINIQGNLTVRSTTDPLAPMELYFKEKMS